MNTPDNEYLIRTLKLQAGDTEEIRGLSKGCPIRFACLFYLFYSPNPNDDEKNNLKEEMLKLSKGNQFLISISHLVTDSFGCAFESISKNYPSWFTQ